MSAAAREARVAAPLPLPPHRLQQPARREPLPPLMLCCLRPLSWRRSHLRTRSAPCKAGPPAGNRTGSACSLCRSGRAWPRCSCRCRRLRPPRLLPLAREGVLPTAGCCYLPCPPWNLPPRSLLLLRRLPPWRCARTAPHTHTARSMAGSHGGSGSCRGRSPTGSGKAWTRQPCSRCSRCWPPPRRCLPCRRQAPRPCSCRGGRLAAGTPQPGCARRCRASAPAGWRRRLCRCRLLLRLHGSRPCWQGGAPAGAAPPPGG
jgi:hypothetical protein